MPTMPKARCLASCTLRGVEINPQSMAFPHMGYSGLTDEVPGGGH